MTGNSLRCTGHYRRKVNSDIETESLASMWQCESYFCGRGICFSGVTLSSIVFVVFCYLLLVIIMAILHRTFDLGE